MTRRPDLDIIIEAFARNGELNGVVVGALTEPDLEVADGLGGWSIGQHLGHVIEFRYGWLSAISPSHAQGIPSVADNDGDGRFRLTTTSLPALGAAFRVADEAVSAAVFDAHDTGRSFERAYRSHPAQFMVHTLVHDAHHRGQIMSLLRASGRRTGAQMEALDDVTWPIWRR